MSLGRALRVVTLNTWKGEGDYHARLIAMIYGLRELRPDIVLLQESLRAPALQMDTGANLARCLDMQHDWLPLRRKARRIGGDMVDSWSGLCLLSRLQVLSHRRIDLDCDPADGERAAQLAMVVTAGVRLAVANLHLTHLEGADVLRRLQLRQVAAATNEAAADAVIIGGDFNAPCADLGLDDLNTADRPLRDPRTALRAPELSTLVTGERCIDHLLLAAGDALKPVAINHLRFDVPVDASDHRAVVLDGALYRSTVN